MIADKNMILLRLSKIEIMVTMIHGTQIAESHLRQSGSQEMLNTRDFTARNYAWRFTPRTIGCPELIIVHEMAYLLGLEPTNNAGLP
jgi:hypothetical protein